MAEPRDLFIVCNSATELGGLVRWAHHMAGVFAGRGHRVHLIGITPAAFPITLSEQLPYQVTTLHGRQPPPPSPRRGLASLNPVSRAREWFRVRGQRRGAARLSELFRAARPGGVVIAAQIWAMEWVARADTGPLKVVGMTHESYAATRATGRYARVKRYYAGTDCLLALTAEDADQWAVDGMSQADSMPNPVMVTPTRYPSRAEPVVVALGRLSHEKGLDLLLEAWQRITLPEWRLALYGDGPEESALRRQAAELGISASVDFHGATADVEGALVGGSVLALPSRAEGFPITVTEAMAYGLPTVAFDCAPGVRELLVDGESGLLVHPGNVIAFAAALERVMKDADLRRRLGDRAREAVAAYSSDAVAARWEELFARLYR